MTQTIGTINSLQYHKHMSQEFYKTWTIPYTKHANTMTSITITP